MASKMQNTTNFDLVFTIIKLIFVQIIFHFLWIIALLSALVRIGYVDIKSYRDVVIDCVNHFECSTCVVVFYIRLGAKCRARDDFSFNITIRA